MILALISLYVLVATIGVIGIVLLPGSSVGLLLAGLAAALIAGVFWVVLAVQGVDLVHSLKGADRTFARQFLDAVRPTPVQWLISTAITLLAWLLAHAFLNTSFACGLLSGLPLFALAIAKVARFERRPARQAANRIRWSLIGTSSGLIVINLCLLTHWSVETPPRLTSGWAITSMLVVATVLYVAASNYTMAIETGVIQRSPLLQSMVATPRSAQRQDLAPSVMKQTTYRGPPKSGKRTRRVR